VKVFTVLNNISAHPLALSLPASYFFMREIA
jgi:hypothetical protein